ncbi:MAG: chemotaxis response regulator protein-glutamate methylesterase [Alphaproteobacteria bacterium]|nr:chemotaxis response regulator protein-glutamate methylesterase [Alphaproteobacteria bacterium]
MTRVVIVDDSSLFRKILEQILSRDPEIEVVGMAEDPLVAREMIKSLNPDVITLDIEMPNMDGLSFLEKIMRLRPMPVVMVSTLTQHGAEAALKALEMGAVDYHPKPTAGVLDQLESEAEILCEKVKGAAKAKAGYGLQRVAAAEKKPAPARVMRAGYRPGSKLIAIGSSTGGVEALHRVIPNLPENCPPTVVTQHMPASFTATFANRLNQVSPATVSEAQDGDPVVPGRVYIAPGGPAHLEVIRDGTRLVCRLREGPLSSGHRPSVDVLFTSVAQVAAASAIGVILTGMGRDGASGLKLIRDSGGHTIGQNEESCVVYGMPRVAHEIGGVEVQVSLSNVADKILEFCNAA